MKKRRSYWVFRAKPNITAVVSRFFKRETFGIAQAADPAMPHTGYF